jgi:hypothetical protein
LSVSRLIRAFSTRTVIPVPTDDVLQVLKDWGVRDEIWFHEDDMDTGIIKGQVVEWEAEGENGKVELFAHISTARGLSTAEKRLIQCKELLHLLDPEGARVSDPEAIWNLIKEIVATPDEGDPYGDETGRGDADRRTIWGALAILFPWQVREALMPGFRLGVITVSIIAERIDLPENHVALIMSDQWPWIYGKMTQGAYYEPVINNEGSVVLYDIYIEREWVGSKRTLQQCEDRIEFLLKSA